MARVKHENEMIINDQSCLYKTYPLSYFLNNQKLVIFRVRLSLICYLSLHPRHIFLNDYQLEPLLTSVIINL